MKKILSFCVCLSSFFVFAQTLPSQFNSAQTSDRIYEKLGKKMDLHLSFTNQEGQLQTLQELLNHKLALVLTLNYYRCTTMCTFQYLNLAQVLKVSEKQNLKNYQIATISFDPTDTTQQAKQLHNIWTPKTENPNILWNFYTGDSKNIETLVKHLNFYYERDEQGNYSHAAALFFIGADGTFYRYLYGITYDKDDFEHALKDTIDKGHENVWDKIKGLFNKYDPIRGRYFSIFSNF